MRPKKTPADYPQMAFRISEDDKKNINFLAEELINVSNASLQPKQKLFRKNEILVDALYLGLLELKKRGARA